MTNFATFYKSMSDAEDRTRKLIVAFGECNSASEVRETIKNNIDFMLDYTDTFQFAVNALERLKIIEREKYKSYASILN